MAAEREKMHECEVKRRRVRTAGGYESYWKVKTLIDAIADMDTEFRCKDCGGAVKLMGRNSKTGGTPFVEHKNASDAAYCLSGMAFRTSTDGREARPSSTPVQLGSGIPVQRVDRVPVGGFRR
jgi:hypothetical protein